jgi:hypothetical protein
MASPHRKGSSPTRQREACVLRRAHVLVYETSAFNSALARLDWLVHEGRFIEECCEPFGVNLRPDAFRIDWWSLAEVKVWEVAITSPLNVGKISAYAKLGWELDNHEIDLRLFELDRWGQPREIAWMMSDCDPMCEPNRADLDAEFERRRSNGRAS